MQAWYGRTLAKLVDEERFPALAEFSAAGAFDPDPDPGPDAAGTMPLLEFGLAASSTASKSSSAPDQTDASTRHGPPFSCRNLYRQGVSSVSLASSS
jgi:hypothetical protein